MSTAPTIDAANLRNKKAQVFSALALAKNLDAEDYANAIPITAGSGAPSHTAVIGELYIRTDGDTTVPSLYRATTTAIWEPIGGYQAAIIAASAAVTNTTTETDFNQTLSIPANTLTQGSKLRLRCQGIATSTNSTDTLSIKLYVGSTAVVTIPAVDVANNDIWYIDFELSVRDALGASAACVGAGVGGLGTSGTLTAKPLSMASTTFATNGALIAKAAATWSVASASNSCRLDILTVEVV